jgi:hypothetical protein
MNDRGFDVYSSGFARLSPLQAGTGYREPDTMAVTHYDGMVKGQLNVVDAKHFDSVMRNALALLGTGPDWIMVQAMNPNLSKYQVDFMVDTINYIVTGKRRYYLATWRELNAEANNNGSVKPIVMGGRTVNPEIKVPPELLKGHPTEIISRWIAREGGVVDLIESLHLMFGGDIEVGEIGSLVAS